MKPPPETFAARLASARMVTSRVREMIFERVDGAPFVHQSGQWVSLKFPFLDFRGNPARRSYSISSVPKLGSGIASFEILVTKVDGGQGSTYLHNLNVGDEMEVKGPQGLFLRPIAVQRPTLFVATGTGVAPFRGMVADALGANHTTPMRLLFGVRSEEDYLLKDEFEALQRAHPNFGIAPTLSRPGDGWTGRRGYVQDHLRSLWSELGPEPSTTVYICGVMKMLKDVRGVFKDELGLTRDRIHAESYG